MTKQKRPTLADVAEASGMSKAAVSLILNDKPGSRLSADAAARVRTAAAELGYRPNPAAQSLRLGKTRTVGFISDEVTLTRFASGMIRGVLDFARAHDHTVLIAETGGDPGGMAEAVASMLDRRVDGLVVGLLGARLIDLPPVPKDVPVVVVNGATTGQDANVLPNERAAGEEVARTLVDAGHRKVAVVGEFARLINDPRESVTVADRFNGIHAVFDAAGVEFVAVPTDSWHPRFGFAKTTAILEADPNITGIVAGNDQVAFGIYQAAAALGLQIPDDLSVVSFDDEELAEYLRPGLTTARLPYLEMARVGMDMVLGRRRLGHEVLPMPLQVRDSVRDRRHG